MARYKKINNRFYSAPLLYGKTNLKPYPRKGFYSDFFCYFIVEHTCDPEYIHGQALQLLMSQCSGFCFFGAHSKAWAQEFRTVENMIYPNAEVRYDLDQRFKQRDHINDFVDDLHEILSCRPLVPSEIYLVYDDTDIYQKVLDMLGVPDYNEKSSDDMILDHVISSER